MPINLALLEPIARFISDIGKIMVKDDQLDLAFPTRAHSGFSHHWKWGLLVHGGGNVFAELLSIYKFIQTEEYKVNDTPQSFLKRVIQKKQQTYDPQQEAQEARLDMLLQYFNTLKDKPNTKEKFQRNYEEFMYRNIPKNVVYGGKIKLASQRNTQQQHKPSKKTLDPPRVYPPSTNIKLYKPN